MNMTRLLAAAATAALTLGVVASPAMAEPKVAKQVAPDYPRGAERRELEGDVTLEFDISADGAVSNVHVVDADRPGVFDAAAVEAVSKWEYEPGEATSGYRVEISFTL